MPSQGRSKGSTPFGGTTALDDSLVKQISHGSTKSRFQVQILRESRNAPIAQRIERMTSNHEIEGLSPSRGAIGGDLGSGLTPNETFVGFDSLATCRSMLGEHGSPISFTSRVRFSLLRLLPRYAIMSGPDIKGWYSILTMERGTQR